MRAGERPATRLLAGAALVVVALVIGMTALLASPSPRQAPRSVAVSPPAPTTSTAPPATAPQHPAGGVLLHVAAQSQFPELKNGCEMTSVSMLLSAAGHPVAKVQLADAEPRDPTPLVTNPRAGRDFFHQVTGWGDPNVGFVGNVAGFPGYGIYHGPVAMLVNQELPGRALDLTGHPFDELETQLDQHVPVVMWTTATFAPTSDWVSWQGPNGPVSATPEEHAVLLVGYSDTQLFLNDPLTGHQAAAVERQAMLAAWQQLGSQAVSLRPAGSAGEAA